MVHHQTRKNLSLALRRFAAGLITNIELDSVKVDWRDSGAIAVKETAWFLYCDIRSYKAQGRYRLSKSTKRQIAQWILFLHSDKEYCWPEYKSVPVLDSIFNVLTLGRWGEVQKNKLKEYYECGDIEAWPFIAVEEMAEAIASPEFLASPAK